MGAVAELIPQVFFDIYARYIPGLVLFGSWILLLGQEEWQSLLNTVAGGELDSRNALAIATLILLFVPFVVGYVIAPLAKLVQRGNEHGWWLPPSRSRSVYEESGKRRPKDLWVTSDKGAGRGYDWLRATEPQTGAYVAKIRGEFTMNNALSVAFVAIFVMALFAHEWLWALASFVAGPMMAWRGAQTEETFQSTTRKLCEAKNWLELAKNPPRRLIWLMPVTEDRVLPLWEDGKGWLRVEGAAEKLPRDHDHGGSHKVVYSSGPPLQLREETLREFSDWSELEKRGAIDRKSWVRRLQGESPSQFEFRRCRSFGAAS